MDRKYFDSIPLWGTEGKRFEIKADDLSGRIPVTRIEHWQEFAELLENDFFNQHGNYWIFRGHRRYDWSLLPTLGRLTENGIISSELASKQLNLFRLAVRGRIKDTTLVEEDQEDELWSVGQHHGLMTPLLDWTYSPYVALFFAFAKEDQKGEEDNPYRVMYAINKTFVENKCPDIRVMEPRKDDHGRLVNQAGLFTFSPADATIENKLIEAISEFDEFKEADEDEEGEFLAQYICKIYIRNDDREGCLRSLRRMNVHHASLFPDLMGASDYCNILMEDEQRRQAIAAAALQVELSEKVAVSDELVIELKKEEPDVSQSVAENLTSILKNPPESAQVEPGRIQLIANQLSRELQKHQVVDWDSRDSAQAKLRNVIRVTLRKLGYPSAVRDEVVEKIMDAVSSENEGRDD